MAQSNGYQELETLLAESERQLLTANKQVTEAYIEVGRAYRQAFEAAVSASFAQWKVATSLVAKQGK